MKKKYLVERIGHRGDGIVRAGEETLHIPKVLPGETITLDGSRATSIAKASADRIEPFCKHYETCGGCKFQHWREDPYRQWKRDLVVAALSSHALDAKVDDLIDAHGDGRRRVTFHVREINGTWRAGFMQEKSHNLTAVEQCPILVPQLVNSAEAAARFGEVLGPCDVMITAADNGLDVAVKAERSAVARRLPALQGLFNALKVTKLAVNGETLFAHEAPAISLSGVKTEFPIGGFLQATALGETTLVNLALESLKKIKSVADLFCGIGPFTFALAKTMRVAAFDSEKPAIAALQHAIRFSKGLKPVTANIRDLFKNPLTRAELNEFDALVFDPPRAGAEAQVRNIAKSKVPSVIAVSCDPQTFARDAKILVEGGYKLNRVTPVDQFKWTAHVELVASFSR